MTNTNTVETSDGRLLSDWQQPVNRWADLPNSIHNDVVAKKIGMRGGTIPGTVHLNHFRPLIQQAFGRPWFETGTISMFYTFATTHQEDVRAVMQAPARRDNIKVDAWVENADGRVVCKGSVSIGDPGESNYVAGLPLENATNDELRILQDLQVGDDCPEAEDVVIDSGGGEDEYEGILIYPTAMYQPLNAGFPRRKIKPSVGFFGATEIRLVGGPIRLHTPYVRTGEVACLGASPKTEFAWVDSQLTEKATGKRVAEMRHLTRWMKASSELWA